MKGWLILVAAFLLWPGYSSQNVCEEPDEIDFGEIVSTEKAKYLENDRVQYRCNPGYVLEGPEWIQCKGQEWTPRLTKCLAPCRITRQQLSTKNMFVFGGQRKTRFIQSNDRLQFQCNEGYVLVAPSVRKCVDGYMELPLCISERGENCSGPPKIENGDITTLSEKQYRSGSLVEFRCQRYYAMEGQNRSFCDNGTWTKVPICLDPCMIAKAELERQKIEVKNGKDASENIYVQRGHSIELTCKTGYVLATDSSQSASIIHCDGTTPVIPNCKEIICNSPRVSNGSFRPQRTTYHDGDLIRIWCDSGFVFKPDNGGQVVECTKNGWSPPAKCVPKNACGLPPRRANEQPTEQWDAETYVHGHIISYKCRPGYVKTWPIKLHCNNGVWQQLIPLKNCTGISCGHPGDSDYASFELEYGKDFTFGARVVYTCNEGYKMLSQFDYRECRANGWNNEVPHCEKIQCPPPEMRGGRFQPRQSQYMYNEEIEINCLGSPIFVNIPKKFSKCTANGWNPSPLC